MIKKLHTEKEQIRAHRKNVFLVDLLCEKENIKFQDIADFIPGIFHVNDGNSLEVKLMSSQVRGVIELTGAEIVDMGLVFFERYLSPETINNVFPRFKTHYLRGDSESVYTDVQLYKPKLNHEEYVPILTSTKIDPSGKNLVTSTIPFRDLGRSIRAIERVIDQQQFSQLNFDKFQSLTKREKQILTLIAQGWTNKDIGDFMFISANTIRTHRNNIWKKLGIKNFRDVINFAQAFDLI